MRNEAIEAANGNGLRLRVELIWLGDRYGQVISVVDPSGTITVLVESIEGSPDDDWPPSPPLKSLSIQTLPDGRRAALLLGMAGGSHWSASIEAHADKPELLFDLACRHAKAPTWLGNRYRRLSDAEKKVMIRAEGATVVQEEVVAIEPATVVTPTGTTRWRFFFSVAGTVY